MICSSKLNNRAIISACVLAAAGALVFNAFPLFLSNIADRFNFNDEELGLLGTAFLGGVAFISLTAVIWLPRLNWRAVALVSYVLIGCGFMSLSWVESATSVYIAMALFGVGSGAIFTLGTTIAGSASDPDRAFGFKLGTEMIIASLLVFVMTAFIVKQFGFAGFLVGGGILYALTALVIPFVPDNLLANIEQEEESVPKAGGVAAWLAVLALFVQFGAFSGLWGFMERIGSANGLDADTIGTILSISLLVGLAAALLGATLGNRFGQIRPLMVSFVLTIGLALLLSSTQGVVAFAVAACGVSGLIQFYLIYKMGFIVSLDASGKFTILLAFILSLSGAIGPGVVGAVVEESGFEAVYPLVIGVTLVSAILTLLADKKARKFSSQLLIARSEEQASGVSA